MRYGVDTSNNNPHPMAWPAIYNYLKQLGGGAEPFVVHKVIQGTGFVDKTTAVDIVQARVAGFQFQSGYLMDQGNADPAAEVALFKRTTNLPLADDIELPEGLSVAQYIAHSDVLVNIHPMELSYLNQSEEAEGFPNGWGLWLADYNGNPSVTSHPCDMHQYSSTAMIPGAAGRFDLNAWTGSEERFTQFFGGTLASVPVPSHPSTPGDDSMFPANPTEQQFFATIRTLWYLLRKDSLNPGWFNLMWALWSTPAGQVGPLGAKGFGGDWDNVVANIHDSASAVAQR